MRKSPYEVINSIEFNDEWYGPKVVYARTGYDLHALNALEDLRRDLLMQLSMRPTHSRITVLTDGVPPIAPNIAT